LVVVAAGEFGAEVLLGLRADERELLSIDDLEAAATRLGLDAKALLSGPHSYVDRFGEYRAPFGVAVKVAKRCCENFSREVLRYLQAEEQELRQELVSGNLDVSRTRARDTLWARPEKIHTEREISQLHRFTRG
jgi:hypothetical protein